MPFHNGAETAPDGTATALGAVAGAGVRVHWCDGKVVSVSAVTLYDPAFPSS